MNGQSLSEVMNIKAVYSCY